MSELGDLVDLLEEMQPQEKAYSIYLLFCFKCIRKLSLDLPDDIEQAVSLAYQYWFEADDGHVTAQDLAHLNRQIQQQINKSKKRYEIRYKTSWKFAQIVLSTRTPSNDIADHLDWAFELLRHLGGSRSLIYNILLEAKSEIDRLSENNSKYYAQRFKI